VDTKGPRVLVGRVDTIDDRGVHLLDVDVHDETQGGPSKEDYLRKAARLGTWKKLDRVLVPLDDVASIRRLGDLRA
jgi:hypothetical protein